MRILYLSCHSVCEFDEIRLFSELGHKIITQGAYRNPSNPTENSRPPIEGIYYNEHLASMAPVAWGDVISKELIDWCDLVYILGVERWLPPNWDNMKHKKVIWRSIGQSVQHTESVLAKFRREGLKIVRYSPLERNIPGYVGEDAMIRFYKDPEEWCDWNGKTKRVFTVAQAMKKRSSACKFHLFDKATKGFTRSLYGPHNEDVKEIWGGSLSYDEYRRALKDNRVFFFTGTEPAQYTLTFIEAWMTGVPIVAIGKSLAGYDIETPLLIENGVSGFVSDSLLELRSYISQLLDDYDLAKRIGEEGRKSAIEYFGKEKIKEEWRAFFEAIE